MRPDDIPQDVWEKAYKVIEGYYGFGSESFRVGLREVIARAIMAAKAEERDACAKVVDTEAFWRGEEGSVERRPDRKQASHAQQFALEKAASAIRKRGEAD